MLMMVPTGEENEEEGLWWRVLSWERVDALEGERRKEVRSWESEERTETK